MRKWCRFVCTTIADPILESYRIIVIGCSDSDLPTSDLVIPTVGRGTCMNNLPKVVIWKQNGRDSTLSSRESSVLTFM